MFGNMNTAEDADQTGGSSHTTPASTSRHQSKPAKTNKKEDTKVATLDRENIPPRRLSYHLTSSPQTAGQDKTKVRRSSHHVVMPPGRRTSNVSQQANASSSIMKSREQLSTGQVDPRYQKRSSSMVTSGLSTTESHLLSHLSQKSVVIPQQDQESASTSHHNAAADQQRKTSKKESASESKRGSHASVAKHRNSMHKSLAGALIHSSVEDAKIVTGAATSTVDADHAPAIAAKHTPPAHGGSDGNKDVQRVIDQTIVSIKKAVAAHTSVTEVKTADQMSAGHSQQSIDMYGKDEPAFLYKFKKFIDADPSRDVKQMASKLVSQVEPLLSQHLTDNNWKKVKYYIEVINTIQNLRTPTMAIDPEEMLNCGYLRLSKANVEKLEAMCRERGVEPGIHAHSDVTGYDNASIFKDVDKNRGMGVPETTNAALQTADTALKKVDSNKK